MTDTSLLIDAGWNADVPPNGYANRPKTATNNDNPDGLASTSAEIETTSEHMNLVTGDPTCATWTRRYDDPNVIALREHLAQDNGIRGLEIVSPHEVKRAAALLHRDGFVVVRDVLNPKQLARMKAAADKAVVELMSDDPTCAAGGGAGGLPHRYSFGGGSASRHMLYVKEWCELIDLETTTPILTEIFGSAN
jgi:hypothetical protein